MYFALVCITFNDVIYFKEEPINNIYVAGCGLVPCIPVLAYSREGGRYRSARTARNRHRVNVEGGHCDIVPHKWSKYGLIRVSPPCSPPSGTTPIQQHPTLAVYTLSSSLLSSTPLHSSHQRCKIIVVDVP